ncbi:MAG: extracellular solute-binding protein [Oscillospiraceae bacterium]|jgi:ABC-type glycerol-3-phosphate transport system substrate-binding protein|nr:extracellular solute-binding protein [Oscillospiraceae bacterium]
MQKKLRRAVALLVTTVTLMTLITGCKKEETAKTPEFVYVPTYVTLNSDITEMQMPLIHGDTIFYLRNVIVDQIEVSFDEGEGDVKPMPMPRSAAALASSAEAVDVDGDEPAEGEGYYDEGYEDYGGNYYLQDIYEYRLFQVNADGTGNREVAGYRPPPLPEDAPVGNSFYVNNFLSVGDGSAWICETLYYSVQSTGGEWVTKGEAQIRRIELETGATLSTLESFVLTSGSGDDKGYKNLDTFIAAPDGRIMILTTYYDSTTQTSGRDFYVYAADGSLQTSFQHPDDPNGEWVRQPIITPDGGFAVTVTDQEGKSYVRPVDTAAKKLGDRVGEYPSSGWSPQSVRVDNMECMNDSTGIFSFEFGKTDRTYIVDWIDADIDYNNVMFVGAIGSDIICAQFLYDSNLGTNSGSLIRLTKTKYSDVVQKKVLTLACVGLDWAIRSDIIKFNKQDPNYRIKVVDYSVYNNGWDDHSGVTKLSTEIIAGNVPDIILNNYQIPYMTYAAKGVYADLYPLLEKDTELGGRAAILPSMRTVMESGSGKLLQAAWTFSIGTFVGKESNVGAEPGWTMDEFTAALANLAPGATGFARIYTRADLMSSLYNYSINEYVNWESGVCTFDSPEFAKLITYVRSYPETINWETDFGPYYDQRSEIMNDRQLIDVTGIYDFNAFLDLDTAYGGDMAFKGFPCASRQSGTVELGSTLSITSRCSDPDGAWRFVRQVFTKEYQQSQAWWFPTNASLFEERLAEAMTENTADPYGEYDSGYDSGSAAPTGTPAPQPSLTPEEIEAMHVIVTPAGTYIYPKGYAWVSSGDGTDGSIPYYAMTEAQRDKLMKLINSITRQQYIDQKIAEICDDDLKVFFAGQKSAEETARVIQSRVSTYVNEQR